ncbi:MAG: hypothetical protein NZL83_04910, partial [Candidatus Absconditabacterales bacterium]|nr:hypothetical protein [Candidatus Absconditabacterales bacterium]
MGASILVGRPGEKKSWDDTISDQETVSSDGATLIAPIIKKKRIARENCGFAPRHAFLRRSTPTCHHQYNKNDEKKQEKLLVRDTMLFGMWKIMIQKQK